MRCGVDFSVASSIEVVVSFTGIPISKWKSNRAGSAARAGEESLRVLHAPIAGGMCMLHLADATLQQAMHAIFAAADGCWGSQVNE